jgi:hypothetical protein
MNQDVIFVAGIRTIYILNVKKLMDEIGSRNYLLPQPRHAMPCVVHNFTRTLITRKISPRSALQLFTLRHET